MKTHKRTLIMMLVFCVLMTAMPGLIFAETEPPAETAGTSAEEDAAPLPDRDPVPAEEAAAPAEEGKAAEEAPLKFPVRNLRLIVMLLSCLSELHQIPLFLLQPRALRPTEENVSLSMKKAA